VPGVAIDSFRRIAAAVRNWPDHRLSPRDACIAMAGHGDCEDSLKEKTTRTRAQTA